MTERFARVFPKDFLFGTATSAHQVQGSPLSNWGTWEVSSDRKEALAEAGKLSAHGYDNFVAGHACKFEERYPIFFEIAKVYEHNAIRFSINWATVEPQAGEFNGAVIDRYVAMINSALALGLQPIITFYHWTHPMWFEKIGAWRCEDSPVLFGIFVARMMSRIGTKVMYYTPLNEPNVYAHFSYRWGLWPPQTASEVSYRVVAHNLRAAHKVAYQAIKDRNPHALIGIGQSCSWNSADSASLQSERDHWHTDDLDELEPYLDFIGVQTYMHSHYHADGTVQAGWEGRDPCSSHEVVSDLNWGMCPRSIYEVVKSTWNRYHKPIMITEHGHAVREVEDHRRCWYLWKSMGWIERAIQEGIPLMGYLHWSLLDNFEWECGWWPKFGLIEFDHTIGIGRPRRSAELYRDIILAGGTHPTIAKRYSDVIRHPHAALVD
ncbi:MAG: family 1 glycosylhydrolase [Candidatus Pacebacteria bacterium]|nr:family 1 glycosylhydrolase [Candidatus Paceibacterota bacterium]